LAFDWRWSKN
jgi:hypothetical protein